MECFIAIQNRNLSIKVIHDYTWHSLPVTLVKFISSFKYDSYYCSNWFDHTKLQCCLDNKLNKKFIIIKQKSNIDKTTYLFTEAEKTH